MSPFETIANCPDEFHLPVNLEENKHNSLSKLLRAYRTWIRKNLNEFEPFWKSIDISKNIADKFIKEQISTLTNVIDDYVHGRQLFSYNNFYKFFFQDNASLTLENFDSKRGFFYWASATMYGSNQSYFRIRQGASENSFSKLDLFHIPYEKRHLVRTMRFSIEGVPLLYLGSNSFNCWKELNEPDLNNCHFSRFELTNDEKHKQSYIINLAYDFRCVSESQNKGYYHDNETIAYYLLFWPLILSCHLKKKHDSSFNVEYIIPNLFLQSLNVVNHVRKSTSTLTGVCYFSTKRYFHKLKLTTYNDFIPHNIFYLDNFRNYVS